MDLTLPVIPFILTPAGFSLFLAGFRIKPAALHTFPAVFLCLHYLNSLLWPDFLHFSPYLGSYPPHYPIFPPHFLDCDSLNSCSGRIFLISRRIQDQTRRITHSFRPITGPRFPLRQPQHK